MSRVSIVIPTLNEENSLRRTLRQLTVLEPPAKEIIVVDGGSEDETVSIAKLEGVKVLVSPGRGRGTQMNYGAIATNGDILCFVHADTLVPDDLVNIIENTLAQPGVICGGFISLMVGPQTTRWGISVHNYLKTYYAPLFFRPLLFLRGLRLLFGDQVIFCRKSDFDDCGGFDEQLPIMEDGDLCRKLGQFGRIRLVNRIVQSSDRRVARWGARKATFIYLYIGILWGLGVDANYLKRFYQDIR